MPTEYHRTRGRKTIELPGGDRITIPVITKVSFIDPVRRYQETEHSFDNTETSTRRVHVDQVHPVNVDEDGIATDPEAPADTSTTLYVERIDTWNSVDPVRRGQETQLTLDNSTGNDLLPPHFTNHERTHVYRYFQDQQNPDDNGVWVDSELIDEFRIVDPVRRNQEVRFTLDNPTNAEFRDGDLSGQASDADPDITIGGDAEGTEANPVRLDPFQNIVNYASGSYVLVLWTWQDWFYNSASEVWIRSTLLGPLDTFVAGIPSQLHSVGSSTAGNVEVTFDEDNSEGATQVFESDYVLEDEATTDGPGPLGLTPPIHIFGPCESPPTVPGGTNIAFPAGCPVPGHPELPLVQSYDSSACVPIIGYQKTFLFKAAPTRAQSDLPTSAEPVTPTKILFNVANAIGPAPNIISYGSYTVAGTPNAFTQQQVANNIGALRFHIYVFSSNSVEPFLEDEEFPLRKKGLDDPTAGDLSETLALPHTSVNCNAVLGYVEAGDIKPVLVDGTYDLRIESFTVPDDAPGKTRSIPWPKTPSFITSGGLDYRRYHYTIVLEATGETLENDPPDIKFGTPPP